MKYKLKSYIYYNNLLQIILVTSIFINKNNIAPTIKEPIIIFFPCFFLSGLMNKKTIPVIKIAIQAHSIILADIKIKSNIL